ncbi:MAG: SIMPL domain-containing protein [Gammaproteobacteria bacterium]
MMHEIKDIRLVSIILVLPILLSLPVNSLAHEYEDHYDRVQLSASAQTQVDNDTVIVTLYAQEEGSDSVQLVNLVNDRIEVAIRYIKQHDAIKVQTGGYSTTPVYHNNKITGWRVRQSLRLESLDMALTSQVLGHLQQTLSLQGMNFTVSPELKNTTDDELIGQALTVFEQRAKAITSKLGRKNYKIVDINVSTQVDQYPRRNYEVAAMASKMAAPPIESGEQTLQVTVSGQIEME